MKIRIKYGVMTVAMLILVGAMLFLHNHAMASFHMSKDAARLFFDNHSARMPEFSFIDVGGNVVNVVHQAPDKRLNALRAKKNIVFIHGSPGGWSAFQYYFLDPRLKETATIVSIDRPGFGYSTPHTAVSSLREQARRIYVALSALGLDKNAILVGHSLGGPLAIRFAIDYPDAVDSLLLLAPSLSPELEKRKWFNYLAKPAPLRWLIPKDWRVSNDEIFPHKAELEILRQDLPKFQKKTILIQGENDSLVPKENAYYLEKEWVHAQQLSLWLIPNAGHFLPWQHKEKVVDALVALMGISKT